MKMLCDVSDTKGLKKKKTVALRLEFRCLGLVRSLGAT